MGKLRPAIWKLIKGLREKYGQRFLYATEQKWSEKYDKAFINHRISMVLDVDEYNERFPDSMKDSTYPYGTVTIPMRMFRKEYDTLMYLLDIWKKLESGEMNGEGEAEGDRGRDQPRED